MQKGGRRRVSRYSIAQLDDYTYTIIDRTTDEVFILWVVPISTTIANVQIIIAEASSHSGNDQYIEFVREVYSVHMFIASDDGVHAAVTHLIDHINKNDVVVSNPVEFLISYGGTLHGLPNNVPHPTSQPH